MIKWLIIIILMFGMFFILGGITNATECEISTDNTTFSNITTTKWNGCTDDFNSIASIQNLDCSTEYTIRCKDSTTSWGYKTFRTEPCGVNEMEIAIISFIGILIIFGIVMIFYLTGIAKTIPIILTTLFITYGFNLLANLADSAGVSATVSGLLWFGYKIMLYLFWAIVLFVLVAFISHLTAIKVKLPQFNSPLRQAKEDRKRRQGKI